MVSSGGRVSRCCRVSAEVSVVWTKEWVSHCARVPSHKSLKVLLLWACDTGPCCYFKLHKCIVCFCPSVVWQQVWSCKRSELSFARVTLKQWVFSVMWTNERCSHYILCHLPSKEMSGLCMYCEGCRGIAARLALCAVRELLLLQQSYLKARVFCCIRALI